MPLTTTTQPESQRIYVLLRGTERGVDFLVNFYQKYQCFKLLNTNLF